MEVPARVRVVSLTFLLGFGFGIFAGVGLALAAVALVRDPQVGPAQALVFPTETPVPGVTPSPTPEVRPRTRGSLEVRLGPGNAFAVVGTLDRNQPVDVVGRDQSGSWLAIRFPPNSTARGWVQAADIDGLSAVETLSVVAPTPVAQSIVVPTPGPRPAGGAGITPGSSGSAPEEPQATATSRPSGPVDLVVNSVSLLPDGRVSVVVGNRGPADLVGQSVFVELRDLGTRAETLISPQRSLSVGATIALQSSTFRLEGETEVIATVDPFTAVQDANRGNNRLRVTLSPPPPTPAPTPLPGSGD